MKYLFEYSEFSDHWRSDKDIEFMNSLEKGDYVLITCDDHGLKNNVMILTTDPEETADGFTVHAKDINGGHYKTYYDHEIVKKLTPEEAEYLIAINKYNL